MYLTTITTMKKLFLLSILLFIYTTAVAQTPYYRTNTTEHYGDNIIGKTDRQNCQFLHIKMTLGQIKMTPLEVDEYRLKDGRVYISKAIPLHQSKKQVFLERILNGPAKLYYYTSKDLSTFFIEKDSTLTQLKKKGNYNYKDFLLELSSDCNEDMEKLVQKITYTRSSLSRFLNQLSNCDSYNFAKKNIGFLIGYGYTKTSFSSNSHLYTEGLRIPSQNNYLVGAFYQIPIKSSNFKLKTEIISQYNAYYLNQSLNNTNIHFLHKKHSISASFLIGYHLNVNKFQFYLYIGLAPILDLKSNIKALEVITNNDVIVINNYGPEDLNSLYRLGYIFTFGTSYDIKKSTKLFIELRSNYNHEFTNTIKVNEMNVHLTTGITI